MGVTDAPAWILAAWRRSLRDVGATADQDTLDSYGQRMIERWSAPQRIHHNLRRLIAVLARVDELAPETHDPNMVRLAAWYHGAVFNAAAQDVYARRGGIDEEASAQLARGELAELGVPEAVVERIAAMIQGSTHHAASKQDIDAQALCDADLGGLAVDPQRYGNYRKEVRQEYAHIPQSDYVRARLAIVSKLLARPYLFQSPMAQPWEDSARENLTAELNRLTAEAAKLPAVDAEAIETAADQREQGSPGACSGQDSADSVPTAQMPRDASEAPVRDYGPVAGSPQKMARPAQPESESEPSGRAAPASAPSPARDEGSQPVAGRQETLAERSQRRWEELNAARLGDDAEAARQARRRGVSAASPAEPGPGNPSRSKSAVESGADEAEEIDKTSSLSRPPKMPAVKRRPREDD